MTTQCVFCDRKSEEFCIIEQTTHSYAKICKWPLHPSHTLILPKRHVTELDELTPDEAADLITLATKIAKRAGIVYGMPAKLIQNYGEHRSQPHIHLHVICYEHGLRTLITGKQTRVDLTRDEMTELAKKLK